MNVVLGDDRGDEAVQGPGAGEVGSERLLEDQPGAVRDTDPGQRRAGLRRHRRRQGEVDRRRLLANRKQCTEIVLGGRIGRSVAGAGDDGVGSGAGDACGGERCGDLLAPAGVVPVVGAGTDQQQALGTARGDQAAEPGEQETGGQVAARPEDQQRLRCDRAIRFLAGPIRPGAHLPTASGEGSGPASWPSYGPRPVTQAAPHFAAIATACSSGRFRASP